ncbi:hypothetical protein ABVT39_020636 [Epinephelus coioides]
MAAVTQQATSRNGGSPRKHATQKGGEPVEREVQIARLQVRSTDRSRVRGDTIAVRRGRITMYYKQTQTSRRIADSSNTGNIFTISVQPNSDTAVRINKPLQT